MHIKRFARVVAALIVTVGVVAGAGAPSGAYESRLPDGTAIRLTFRDAGAVRIAMTEDGTTNAHDGKWILNGEVILVEGGEGMTLQLSWKGDALVSEFGGVTLTFKKVWPQRGA